jgi:aspartyl-tRNA(Asn)/glutamyl-tRNA(Gln) amidotransferase subunit C
MTIDKETVDKIAHLARLEITDAERTELMQDMGKILDFMAKLNEVDTEGVEPLIYMTENVLLPREDVMIQKITREEALKNAPAADAEFFKVAKVIG